MFLPSGVYHPWGPPPVTLGTQNLYLFATGQRLIQRYLFPIYSFIYLLFIYSFGRCLRYRFPLHSITPNSRLSLMPIFTGVGVSINCGLYFQANQEKYQGNCLQYKFFNGVAQISLKILTIDTHEICKKYYATPLPPFQVSKAIRGYIMIREANLNQGFKSPSLKSPFLQSQLKETRAFCKMLISEGKREWRSYVFPRHLNQGPHNYLALIKNIYDIMYV